MRFLPFFGSRPLYPGFPPGDYREEDFFHVLFLEKHVFTLPLCTPGRKKCHSGRKIIISVLNKDILVFFVSHFLVSVSLSFFYFINLLNSIKIDAFIWPFLGTVTSSGRKNFLLP